MSSLFNRYINFILEDNSLSSSNNLHQNVRRHIYKLDQLILLLIKIYLISLAFISTVFFLKPFKKTSNKQIQLAKKCLFLLNFLIKKIDQVFFVIISMHVYGNETLMETKAKESKNNSKNYASHFKFIVIGSGPSGAVHPLEMAKQ